MLRETRALLTALFARFAAYQAAVLLTAVYWSAIAITALVLRVSGRRLLTTSFGSRTTHWLPRAPFPQDPKSLRRQF